MRDLDKLIKGDHILGVKDDIFDKDRLCSACCKTTLQPLFSDLNE